MTLFAPLLGLLGLAMALAMYRHVVAQPSGTALMVDIAGQIHTGAMAFLRREYSISPGSWWWWPASWPVFIPPLTAVAFIGGALRSMLAGLFEMKAATRANVRTANAARESGRDKALAVAFYGGSVMGLSIASHGLLGLGTLFVLVPDPRVVIGLFLGGIVPYLIAALTMRAVGRAAFGMVQELRRQFREIRGLMEGTAKADTARCVEIATAAVREKVVPGVLAVALPPVIGFVLGKEALGGFLAGATLMGVFLALMMANAGGAWDNAKKHIEGGHLGGKGAGAHKAAVVGGTVGDPFKDTCGPALNILTQMSVVALVIAPLLR